MDDVDAAVTIFQEDYLNEAVALATTNDEPLLIVSPL
jgi:hypothetical protein